MKSRIRILIAILLVLNMSALLYLRAAHQRAAVQKQRTDDLNAIAAGMERSGAMTGDEYYRLQEVDKMAVTTGRLGDDDLDWCLNLMHLRGGADASRGAYVRGHVENVLRLRIAYTQPQKDKLFHQVVEPAFALRDASAVYDRIEAAKLVRVTGDKRAVPFLLPMLNDKSNAYAVKFAREALDSLGYSQ